MNTFLDANQAAEFLGISVRQLRRWNVPGATTWGKTKKGKQFWTRAKLEEFKAAMPVKTKSS